MVEQILNGFLRVYKRSKKIRTFSAIYFPAIVLTTAAFVFLFFLTNQVSKNLYENLIFISIGFIFIPIAFIGMYGDITKSLQKEDQIKEKEKEVERHPEKTKAAWDLAQEKLEHYLNRNLSQVRSIYWLCILVMLIGFGFVGYGVYIVYDNPESMNPSILSAVSGILISFLGGSFLFIYKSTMTQAKEYVAMLERINAVGMSLQILDTLDGKIELKEKSKAEIAKELLKIYAKKQ
jgi:TRADD-N domain-containing protein